MPGLPQRIDLFVPLQDHFFPEVDPDDAGVLPLGIRQVPQDAPQGLGEGVGKGDGRAGSPLRVTLPTAAVCAPSPWSWAVLSHRRAFWAPVGSWPRSSPWRCSARPGRSAHPPPAAEQSPGKGCTPLAITAAPSHGFAEGVPSTPQPLTRGPRSGEVPKPLRHQPAGARSHAAAFQRWETLFLQRDRAKATALASGSSPRRSRGPPRNRKLQLG